MYIDPIHAGPVALAHAFALAARAPRHFENSAVGASSGGLRRWPGFKPLLRLMRWWRPPYGSDFPTPEPAQLMMWSECPGHPQVTGLDGVLMINQLRRKRATATQDVS
jgi:hypothetical protein